MDILSISNEIRKKVNHISNLRSNSYMKEISSLPEDEKEIKMSIMYADITFEVSENLIKEKLAKFNPKPLKFSFQVNKRKYFQQTIEEIKPQLSEDIFINEEKTDKCLKKIKDSEQFVISFEGFFLKDNGFIGRKKIYDSNDIEASWVPFVLDNLEIKNGELKELDTIKKLIQFGFKKAISLNYVFIDSKKLTESLASVDDIIFEDNKITVEEFESLIKIKSMGSGSKKGKL